MKDRNTRELEEMLAAVRGRLGDLSELLELAQDAKAYLFTEHAVERDKRQKLEAELRTVYTIVVDLKQIVGRRSMGTENDEKEVDAVLRRANDWTIAFRGTCG